MIEDSKWFTNSLLLNVIVALHLNCLLIMDRILAVLPYISRWEQEFRCRFKEQGCLGFRLEWSIVFFLGEFEMFECVCTNLGISLHGCL